MRDARLVELLDERYGIEVQATAEVAEGADRAATVIRVTDRTGRRFAVKRTTGGSTGGVVLAARWADAHPGSTPRPVAARTGQLWVEDAGQRVTVTAWVEGPGALAVPLGRDAWVAYGRLLARLHALPVDAELRRRLPREDLDPSRWIEAFDRIDARAGSWPTRGADLRVVRDTTAQLAATLRERAGGFGVVPCHADAHLGNLVVAGPGRLTLLDLDDAVLAPRERDLMFVLGGGVIAEALATREQQGWFLDGYGDHELDRELLRYYRGLRVLEDVTDPAAVSAVLSPGALLEQALDGEADAVDGAELRARVAELRDRTQARLVALDRQRASIVETAAMEATDDEHDPEGATIAFERAQVTALRDDARRQLRDLDDVLARLDGDDVGRCERCGGPIGAARLLARPTARRCVGCADA